MDPRVPRDPAAGEPPLDPTASHAPVPLETLPCLLCGAERFTTVLDGLRDLVWNKPGRFRIQRCDACDLVQTRPRVVKESLSFYYRDTYGGEDGQGTDLKTFYDSPVGEILNRYRVVTLQKVHAPGPEDRVLDVGCSFGHFLRTIQRETGCQIAGLDFDPGSIAQSVLDDTAALHTGELTDDALPEDHFTVVSFHQCLEHVPDPLATLRSALRVLQPGGLVVVEVPNFSGLWRHVFGSYWFPLFMPQHLVHFDRRTLPLTLEAAGFEVIHSQTLMWPVEVILSLDNLARPYLGRGRQPDASLGERARVWIWTLFLHLVFWTVELPAQLVLRIIHRAGHQTVIGRKPAPDGAGVPPT